MAEMLIGAALLLAGMGIGRFWPGRRRGPKPSEPVCGCSHKLAYHEPAGEGIGGTCHASVAVNKYDSSGDWVGEDRLPCACRQYTGPRQLDPGYVARELT